MEVNRILTSGEMPYRSDGASGQDTPKERNCQSVLLCFSIDESIYLMHPVTFMTRSALSFLLISLIPLTGCLTVAEKEYRIVLRNDFSGEATIRFIDIASESDDTTDVSADDFNHLIGVYLNGTELEEQNPGWRNVQKRLYEENGVLCGEVSFEFDSLADVWLFRFDHASPLMYYIGTDPTAEEVLKTNGTFRPETMPVIFWTDSTRVLFLHTRIRSENPNRQPLVSSFRTWKQNSPDPRRQEQ